MKSKKWRLGARMAMFALPRMNNKKERSKWLCEKQEMAKALDLEPGWRFLYCFLRTVYQRPVKPRSRKEISCLAKFEPRLQFLHSVSAAGQARTTIAIFMLPQTNSLSAAGQAQNQDFEKERSKWPCEKQEMAKALDLEPGWQFLCRISSLSSLGRKKRQSQWPFIKTKQAQWPFYQEIAKLAKVEWPFYQPEAAKWPSQVADCRFHIVPHKQFISGQAEPFFSRRATLSRP